MEEALFGELASLEDAHWWFEGRRRIAGSFLPELPPASRILDVGAGTGGNLGLLSSLGEASGIEPSSEARQLAKAKGIDNISPGKAEKLQLEGESFDLVTCFDVLEHLDDDVVALREFRRVLRPGGNLVVTVPACAFLWSYHDESHHHRRRYSKRELVVKLEEAGLKVHGASFFYFFSLPIIVLVRVVKGVLLRDRANAVSDLKPVHPLVNKVLVGAATLEALWLRRFPLPLGSSLIALACRESREDSGLECE